jgi:RimJ/RimL family protein N-acetyltransferase
MQLHFYDESFNHLTEQYKLTEEQLRFTGTPNECIKLSNEDLNRHSILAIDNDKLVTFFVLHRNNGVKPYSENDKSILIRSFSTDYRHQGNGYAKKALMLLPDFVKKHFSDINEIVLAVNIKNEVAQGLYKKCGYVDEGARKMGRKGELMIMSCYL